MLCSLVAILIFQRRELWARAFAASSLFIVGLLTTMASSLYPNVLPAHDGHPYGLTVHNAASGHTALTTALFWWPVGMLLAAVYFVYPYRLFFRDRREPTIETH